jgi:hypothetical protein
VANLISATDLEEYGVTVEPAETATVTRLIRAASDAVCEAAKNPILEVRSEVTLLAMPGTLLRLPGLPIREIHSITDGTDPITGWLTATGGAYLATGWALQNVTVDYTHGLPLVPEDIIALVVSMVTAGLLAVRDGEDAIALNNGLLSSFAIDDYKEAYATGGDAEAVTPMALTERTQRWLAKRFGAGAHVAGML